MKSLAMFLYALIVLSVTGSLSAQEQLTDAQREAIWSEADAALIRGPEIIPLRDQAVLALPSGFGFVPQGPAAKLMDIMGNQTDERFIGLIYPLGSDDKNWFVTVDYEDAGYIEDGDAKHWDAEKLLDGLKAGTEEGNSHRVRMGLPALQISRWIEVPSYDPVKHHLVWSAEVRLQQGDDPDPTVNYNTYVLGREGYVAMDLVTSLSSVAVDKPDAETLLAAITFKPGKRYADFDSSTDKVAAYGLAALVGGLAAKKLGLLAALAVFVAKFAKIIVAAAVAGGVGLRKFFKRKSTTENDA